MIELDDRCWLSIMCVDIDEAAYQFFSFFFLMELLYPPNLEVNQWGSIYYSDSNGQINGLAPVRNYVECSNIYRRRCLD